MHFDFKPCEVCGSEVTLRASAPVVAPNTDAPVGPPEGYVGGGDETVDERICSNPDCPTDKG